MNERVPSSVTTGTKKRKWNVGKQIKSPIHTRAENRLGFWT